MSVKQAGAGHWVTGTFGHRRLGEQEPWRRTVIKCNC